MAKKAGRAEAAQPTSEVLARLQVNMKSLQRDAEALLKRTRTQAAEIISKDQQRALDRLLRQAQALRDDLEQRTRRASQDVEAQADRLLATIEKEATKRIRPFLERLDLPSRAEVRSLGKRVARLEKKLRPSRSRGADSAATRDD